MGHLSTRARPGRCSTAPPTRPPPVMHAQRCPRCGPCPPPRCLRHSSDASSSVPPYRAQGAPVPHHATLRQSWLVLVIYPSQQRPTRRPVYSWYSCPLHSSCTLPPPPPTPPLPPAGSVAMMISCSAAMRAVACSMRCVASCHHSSARAAQPAARGPAPSRARVRFAVVCHSAPWMPPRCSMCLPSHQAPSPRNQRGLQRAEFGRGSLHTLMPRSSTCPHHAQLASAPSACAPQRPSASPPPHLRALPRQPPSPPIPPLFHPPAAPSGFAPPPPVFEDVVSTHCVRASMPGRPASPPLPSRAARWGRASQGKLTN